MEYCEKETGEFTREKLTSHSEGHTSVSDQRKKDVEVKEHVYSLASPTPEKKNQPPRSRKYKDYSTQSRIEEGPSVVISEKTDYQRGVSINDLNIPSVEQSFSLSRESLKEKTSQLSEKYKSLVEIFDQMVVSVRLLSLKKRLNSFHNIRMQVEILAKKKFSLSYLAQVKFLLPEAIQIEKTLVHDELSQCMKPDIRISLKVDAIKNLSTLQQASYADLCLAFRARLLDFLNEHPKNVDIPEAPIFENFGSLTNLVRSPDQLPSASPALVAQVPLLIPSEGDPLSYPTHLPVSFKGYFSRKNTDPDEQMTESCSISSHQENTMSAHQDDDSLTHSEGEVQSSEFAQVNSLADGRTPVKVSVPVKLTTETPAQSTPKRPLSAIPSHSARRVLLYSPSNSSEHGCHDPTDEEQENTTTLVSRRQQVLACLPGTVNTIYSVVGASCTMITKQELVHKILSYNCDVEDPCEAEEQLSLLEELVPDWIRCKSMSTGDSLYWISRASDPKAVLARLVKNPC
ncbi:CDT1-like protein a, chloroplastic [Wolffia australiana]